jgi:uncharacterized protein involved in type VI secretion and phage assembly
MLYGQNNDSGNQMIGVMVGIVTDNQDKEKLGRVKVKLIQLGNELESNWARVATFMAGKERGAYFLPEKDDEVLVAFEKGDITKPYVIGSLWNGKDKPIVTDDPKNDKRVIKSRSGHIIRLDDKDGEEKLEIIDKTGKNLLVFDSKNNKITISSDKDLELVAKNGKVTIDAKEVEIKTSEKTAITAKEAAITTQTGKTAINAKEAEIKTQTGKTAIDAMEVEIKSQAGKTAINALSVEIKATATANIEATATMDLKASGPLSVKGAIVNIN